MLFYYGIVLLSFLRIGTNFNRDMSQITTLEANKQIIITSDSSKKRILIVDDEPDITLTIMIVLQS